MEKPKQLNRIKQNVQPKSNLTYYYIKHELNKYFKQRQRMSDCIEKKFQVDVFNERCILNTKSQIDSTTCKKMFHAKKLQFSWSGYITIREKKL